MRLVHDRLCPRGNCRAKSVSNFACLTSFTKINLNVKPVKFWTRDSTKYATGSRQVVSSWQLSCKIRVIFACLTSFTKINLNAVKPVIFCTRDKHKICDWFMTGCVLVAIVVQNSCLTSHV